VAERRPTDRAFLAGSNELDSSRSRSNQSRVVERYTLSADGLKIDYEITVTDPVMLAEPWAWGGSFIYREGAELRAWNCGADRG